MIKSQIDKLRFIVEEMQVAFHVANNIADSFSARTIARHILIRAENFIAISQRLRRPLREAGFETRALHASNKAYGDAFQEYFSIARHKLGAHVQDFDFGKRIELWNDIEVVKLSYFVDGACEIYEGLSALNVPGYVAYAAPSELSNRLIIEALHQAQPTPDAPVWVEMGTDPLAMTRNNTTAIHNATPVHARAGQLVLIGRWIGLQLGLLEWLNRHVAIARILKGRIVTDIVSFCDCLVTRAVRDGSEQHMEGLNTLVQAENRSSSPIGDFVANSNFKSDLEMLRALRNTLGAHLEIDGSTTLSMLLARLDTFDLDWAVAFYARAEAAFRKQCSAVIFLRLYAADGAKFFGRIARPSAALPFGRDTSSTPEVSPAPLRINDSVEYASNLARWLDGDEDQKGGARHFFWQAFMDSDVVEEIKEVDQLTTGTRDHSHAFRKVHQFILDRLKGGLSDSDFRGVLDLLISCRHGDPYPLAEALLRYVPYSSILHRHLTCYALGEIASGPHKGVSDFFIAQSRSRVWSVRLGALIARYKSFVRNEGNFRANHKGRINTDHDALLASMIRELSSDKFLLLLLALCSIHTGALARSSAAQFAADYSAMQLMLEASILPLFSNDAEGSKATTLKRLIETDDYVGVAIHVAANLDGGSTHALRAALLDGCCQGVIAADSSNQSIRHLIICYVLNEDYRGALKIAAPLAERNPDWVDAQILVAEILGQMEGSEVETHDRLRSISNTYKLSEVQRATLAAVEAQVRSRQWDRDPR